MSHTTTYYSIILRHEEFLPSTKAKGDNTTTAESENPDKKKPQYL